MVKSYQWEPHHTPLEERGDYGDWRDRWFIRFANGGGDIRSIIREGRKYLIIRDPNCDAGPEAAIAPPFTTLTDAKKAMEVMLALDEAQGIDTSV